MENFELNVEVRDDMGKGASRRLRRAGSTPGIIYGGDKDPVSITLGSNDLLLHSDNEAFYSHILTLNVGDASEQVVLKDMQRHPFKRAILHIDFLRVNANEKIKMHVPLHYINEEECVGVKDQGGVIAHLATDVEIACLPGNLPEFIEVDVVAVNAGEFIHLSELVLPEGVEVVELGHGEGHDNAIFNVHMPRGGNEDDQEGEEGAAVAADATEGEGE